jgi:hypothetical protein
MGKYLWEVKCRWGALYRHPVECPNTLNKNNSHLFHQEKQPPSAIIQQKNKKKRPGSKSPSQEGLLKRLKPAYYRL